MTWEQQGNSVTCLCLTSIYCPLVGLYRSCLGRVSATYLHKTHWFSWSLHRNHWNSLNFIAEYFIENSWATCHCRHNNQLLVNEGVRFTTVFSDHNSWAYHIIISFFSKSHPFLVLKLFLVQVNTAWIYKLMYLDYCLFVHSILFDFPSMQTYSGLTFPGQTDRLDKPECFIVWLLYMTLLTSRATSALWLCCGVLWSFAPNVWSWLLKGSYYA